MPDPVSIVLTARDFSILESMLLNGGVPIRGLAESLRHKLDVATVVLPADIPPDVATINSRVRFRIEDGDADERTIVARDLEQTVGLTLLVWAPRGMAMIGMQAGQGALVRRLDGTLELLTMEEVLYQPEARLRAEQAEPAAAVTMLASHRVHRRPQISVDGDDPGPSAA